jgi:hypothetical protein
MSTEAEMENFLHKDIKNPVNCDEHPAGINLPKNSNNQKVLIINDSDYKSNKKQNINFSTNYLTIKEEIRLMTYKNYIVYSRNIKSLLFVFLSPIFFIWLLQQLQYLSDSFSSSKAVIDHPIVDLNSINLNCLNNKKNPENCVSLGIGIIVLFYY